VFTGDELDPGEAGVDHAVDRVRAAAADAGDLEDCEVVACLAHGFRDGPASSFGGALGLPSAVCARGYVPAPRCQRGQPSTSTSELRVASRDGTLGTAMSR
jgi:hypothetical protein